MAIGSTSGPAEFRVLAVLAALIGAALVFVAPVTVEAQDSEQLYEGLSEAEKTQARRALQKALESTLSQSTLSWGSTTGARGSTTPLRTFKTKTGSYCRVYRELVSEGGTARVATQVACRGSEGIWEQIRQ